MTTRDRQFIPVLYGGPKDGLRLESSPILAGAYVNAIATPEGDRYVLTGCDCGHHFRYVYAPMVRAEEAM